MKWKTLNPQSEKTFRLVKESRCFLPSLTELHDLCSIEDITAVTEVNTTIQLNVRDIIFHG